MSFAASRFGLHPDTALYLASHEFTHIFPAEVEAPLAIGVKTILADWLRQLRQANLLEQNPVPVEMRPVPAPQSPPACHTVILAQVFD